MSSKAAMPSAAGASPAVLPALHPALAHALQPIIDVHSGVVYAYEALIRGTDSAGFASIDAFFEDAFASGRLLATELGLFERAFTTFRRLPKTNGRRLFLNVDNRVFADPSFSPETIGRIADSLGVPRSAVCLELSEKHETGIGSHPVDVVRDLREAGLRIALDDFGQGFSELKLFYEATPDYVKIDRFFISGIAKSPRKRLFVSTVVNLAHVLGARVVAEGVETEEEFVACRRIGCDLAQGWYVAHPFRNPADAPSIYLLGGIERKGAPREVDRLLESEIQPVEPLSMHAALPEVFDRIRRSPDRTVFPVVDDAGEPIGVYLERDFRDYSYSSFGRDQMTDRFLEMAPARFLVRAPVVEIDSDVEHILDSVATHAEADGVIVTRDMTYVGMLSSAALVRILNETRLRVAQDQNPLSRLPGNASVNRFITSVSGSDCGTRHFCYFDFNHFKPFNDTYGYRQGDRAIVLFADILRRTLNAPDVFLGHVGGDDFFAGLCTADTRAFEAAVTEALASFRAEVESFYEPADRERGYLEALDREGRPQIYPLMTCAAAILVVPEGKGIDSIEDFSRWIAEGKRRAKMSPGALVRQVMQ